MPTPAHSNVLVQVNRGPGPVEVPIETCSDAELESVIAKGVRFGQDGWSMVRRLARFARDRDRDRPTAPDASGTAPAGTAPPAAAPR